MNLQELTDKLHEALEGMGLTEVEITLKPKQQPGSHTKVFVSCETKPEPVGT